MYERKYKTGLTKEPADPPLDLKALYDKVKKKQDTKETEPMNEKEMQEMIKRIRELADEYTKEEDK